MWGTLPEDIIWHILSFIPSRIRSRHDAALRHLASLTYDNGMIHLRFDQGVYISDVMECTPEYSHIEFAVAEDKLAVEGEYWVFCEARIGTRRAMSTEWKRAKKEAVDKLTAELNNYAAHYFASRREMERERRRIARTTFREFCSEVHDIWYDDILFIQTDADKDESSIFEWCSHLSNLSSDDP